MADQQEHDETPDTVSREAFERIKNERDQFKAQAEDLGITVKDLGLTRKMEQLLKGKVADPTVAAEFLLPQIRDVEPDKLGEHLESESMQSRLSAFAPAQPADTQDVGGDSGGEGAPADPGAGFAGPGPNPGSGGQAPDANRKISRHSPEFRGALERGDDAQIQEWFDKGLVEEPVKQY